MNQSDQNTPAQQELVIEDSAEVVATPGLGLAKGIVAISLGVVLGIVVSFLGVMSTMAMGMWKPPLAEMRGLVGLIPFALCLWRGTVAIRKRKAIRVTYLNFGLWLGFLILSLLPIAFFILIALGHWIS